MRVIVNVVVICSMVWMIGRLVVFMLLCALMLFRVVMFFIILVECFVIWSS